MTTDRDNVRDNKTQNRDSNSENRDSEGVTPSRARALLRRDVTVSRRDSGRDNRRDSDRTARGRPVTITATDKRFAGWLAGATEAQAERWKRMQAAAPVKDAELPPALRDGALEVF